MEDPQRAEFLEFDARQLVSAHPPVWKHPLKQQVYDFMQARSEPLSGALKYGRWLGARPKHPA